MTIHTVRCVVLLILMSLAAPAAAQRAPITGQGQDLSYTASDGQIVRLAAQADDDGDGIENALEVNGFTYSLVDGIQPWSGDPNVKHFKTNPLRWSTDEDPYGDFTEASGVNMPPNIEAPFNHPLVAARPVISIHMEDYDVVPLAEITDTEGQSMLSSYTNTTTNEDQAGGSVSAGFSLNPFELASVDVEANYSHTWINTESTTRDTLVDMSTATTTNPSRAARLKLRLYYQNRGSAAALNVRPTFNLLLGEKVITTYQANDGEEKAGFLAPEGQAESRYPQVSVIAIGDDDGAGEIVLTLEELKAVEAGAPLSLVVTQVEADVPRWNADTNTWECPGQCRWADFEGFMDPVSVALQVEIGDEAQDYYVFAGTPQYDPQHTLRDVLALLFEVEERDGVTYVDGRRYPDAWYASSPSQPLIEAWEDAGRPPNMLDLRMQRRTRLLLSSPGPDPGPLVDFATWTADLRNVLASARANGGFPILSAHAVVLTENGEETVPLVRAPGDAFYHSVAPASGRILGGRVIFEDARGDKSGKRLQAPALARDCARLKPSLPSLPNPGGEFVVFGSQDADDAMHVYCAFFSEDGQELDAPVTYPLFASTASQSLSDVHFFDVGRGIAVGRDQIYRTTDGGETWTPAFVPIDPLAGVGVTIQMNAVSFADDRIGVAVGAHGVIWRTTDGGRTWTAVVTASFTGPSLTDVALRDEQVGVAITGDNENVLRTTDGGLTWTSSPTGLEYLATTEVAFAGDSDTVVIVGDRSVHRSTDAGQTWTMQLIPTLPHETLTSVAFASDQVGMMAGLAGRVFVTMDGGVNWSKLNTGLNNHDTSLWGIDMVGEQEVFVVGYRGEILNGVVLHSTDGGTSWEEVRNRAQGPLWAVDFLDSRTGFAVGEDPGKGLVLRTRPVNATGGTTNPDGGSIAPQDLLVYYGWPSAVNGTFSVDGAAEAFGQYGYAILGDGLQAGSHADHANTTAIINHSATTETKFFGYVDLGVTTQNLSMADFKARVDAWGAMGVEGILLDDYGYDYEVTRARQNEAVAYVHEQGLSVVANAWIPDHAFGTATDAQYNPTGAAPALGAGDYYFAESFQIAEGAYVDGTAWRAKADALAAYQRDIGFGILSVTTTGDENAYDEDQFFYAWYSALLDGHRATGWGEHQYAAVTAQAPYRARPEVAPGAFFLDEPVVNGSIVSRDAENGEIRIDTGQHTYAFGPSTVSREDPVDDVPARITLDQNYPNPFNPSTTIAFAVTEPARVRLEIFDVMGRRVALLVDEHRPSGRHQVRFEARDLASGVYFYRLSTGAAVELRKMLLLR